jgi:hypothetical protein
LEIREYLKRANEMFSSGGWADVILKTSIY